MKKDTLNRARRFAELRDLQSPKSQGRLVLTSRQATCRIKTLRRKLGV